uniref:DUF4476 domain-containing protein n=1 Tax=Heterorhabditis bacteriophora TaxID=37862 RepID=A0A1I7WCR3_HETBA
MEIQVLALVLDLLNFHLNFFLKEVAALVAVPEASEEVDSKYKLLQYVEIFFKLTSHIYRSIIIIKISGFSGSGGIPLGGEPHVESGDFFTGESANSPSRGPTGDGYGPPIFPGGAVPPAVPAVGLGGAAAGKSPYAALEATENPPTTVKPSALLNVLNKADQGFNQAITHFERGSPIETAAIDIMEVALGSQKLDSQAKLLGHVDRAIGLDNLQRIQRWANTAGAMDIFKEQFAKFAKNFQPHPDLLPTVPPQLEYLFKTSGR